MMSTAVLRSDTAPRDNESSVFSDLTYLTASPGASGAVYPGEAATVEMFRRTQERNTLVNLVRNFRDYGLSWSAAASGKISVMTASNAVALLKALPITKTLPKISPDGEGGLMMVWDSPRGRLLVTVDDLKLHAVFAATTPHASYLDNVPFDRPEIPDDILSAIPTR